MLRLSQILSIIALVAMAVILKFSRLSGYSGDGHIFQIYFIGLSSAFLLSLVYSFLYEQHKVFWLGLLSFFANIIAFLASFLLSYITTQIHQPGILLYSIPIGLAITALLNILAFKASIRRSWRR